MKSFILPLLGIFTLLLFCSWGFFGHKKINHLAVFTLPKEMIRFYKHNIDFLTDNAVNPDKRRYAVKEEAARHYLDTDHYGKHPFDSLPQRWNDAVAKYTADTLQAYGIVPWHIQTMLYRLTNAFKMQDSVQILRYSADIGHYIADAHVPLHTTENYNGQLTGQDGIHGLWESRLPELFAHDYDFFVGKAEYIDHPLKKAWQIIKASNAALDSVLSIEKQLSSSFPSDQKYSYEMRGAVLTKVYAPSFCKTYHEQLNGMVERRMRAAIIAVGSYWYTAWVDAGQPDLTKLQKKELPIQEKTLDELADKAFEKGKILGRKEE